MRNLPAALVSLMFVFNFVGSNIVAQTIIDEKDEWIVGVAAFTGDQLSRENSYLLSSVPLLIRNALSAIDIHNMDQDEKNAYSRRLLIDDIREKKLNLARQYETYDQLHFTGSVENRVAAYERIEKIQTQIDSIVTLDPSTVFIIDQKRIVLAESSDGNLLSPVLTNPKLRAERESLDILIWGAIEQLDEYLALDIGVYERAIDATTFYSTAGSRENIGIRIGEIAAEIISVVYGDEWGSLKVEAPDAQSRIWLDSKYLGRGSRFVDFVPAGAHTVRVEAPGYKPAEFKIVVENMAVASLVAVPGDVQTSQIRILTNPPGALTYVGSIWRGRTPVELETPREPMQARITIDGYNEYQLSIGTDEIGDIEITLIPAVFRESRLVDTKRDGFYRSLGLFALSVPIPVFLASLQDELEIAYERQFGTAGASDPMTIQLNNRMRAAGSGSIGGYFIAGAMLVNAFVDLFEYIDLVGLSRR